MAQGNWKDENERYAGVACFQNNGEGSSFFKCFGISYQLLGFFFTSPLNMITAFGQDLLGKIQLLRQLRRMKRIQEVT